MKTSGDFEIFTRSRLLFYKKKKSPLNLITACEALDSFLPVRKDIERVTYANYFVELVNITTTEGDVNEGLYQLLLESLRMLSTTSSAKRISRIFEIKLLEALGLAPQFEKCIKCGNGVEEEAYFSVSGGGMICKKCSHAGEAGLVISLGTINFMRKIQASSLEKAFKIKVSKEVGRETEEALRRFLSFHINRPIRSLKFLSELEKIGVA